ncbi:MAG: VWA domain-containing protein, partial [Thaumarchaeota archaeon]|nr:VWA domain-containing protein [Nitrososphaerota archaeon]
QAVVAKVGEDEALQVWREWESISDAENGLIKQYQVGLEHSRFRGIEFPRYDIVEYQRQRDDLSGTIARVGSSLAGMTNVYEEEGQQKSGTLSLPDAVAAIASGREAEEVFIREELIGRSESLAILIDMSKSLYSSRIPAHKSAIVLAEVANKIMITPNTWSMFGYNDRFYILKDTHENFGKRIKARIGGILQSGITLTPDALRMTANRLAEEDEDMKTIVLVTDGLVTGYSSIEVDLKETVPKLAKTGINVIAIGIQSTRVSSFAKYSTSVNSAYDLARKFVGTYSQLQDQM